MGTHGLKLLPEFAHSTTSTTTTAATTATTTTTTPSNFNTIFFFPLSFFQVLSLLLVRSFEIRLDHVEVHEFDCQGHS